MHPLIIVALSFAFLYLAIGAGFVWSLRHLEGQQPTLWEKCKAALTWPRYAICCLLVLSVIVPTLATAADLLPAQLVPEAGLGTLLQQTVFPVIGAVLMGLASLALQWLGKKYKLEALNAENGFLMKLAHQGITLAEERAAQVIDTKLALNGQNKLAIATGHILSVMPKISEARAQAIVESLLAQIPGVGATADQAYVPGASQLGIIEAPLPAAP